MEYNFVFNACGRYPKVTYESAVWKEWPRHTDPLYKRMISNSILHYFIHFVEKLKNPRHTRDKCTYLHVSRRETTFQEICIGTDRWHHFSLLYFFQQRMNGNMVGNRIRIVTNFPRNFHMKSSSFDYLKYRLIARANFITFHSKSTLWKSIQQIVVHPSWYIRA